MSTSTRPARHSQPDSRFVLNIAPDPPSAPEAILSPWQEADRGRSEENRQCARRSLHCPMVLHDDVMEAGSHRAKTPGKCMDIGNGGLYGTVALGYGVAVGQRYTFRLTIGELGSEPGLRQIVTQQGKIVRTDLMLGIDGSGDLVGIGVQWVGHRDGTVPMPSIKTHHTRESRGSVGSFVSHARLARLAYQMRCRPGNQFHPLSQSL